MSSCCILLKRHFFVWAAALGNAAGHTGNNTPAILAGGQLKHHGSYTQLDEMQQNTKLYLSMIQLMGIEAESFGVSGKTLGV